MGSDISRGLLEFSTGKRLGEKGFRWLKIHLANKMGKDKLSNVDRLSYVEGIPDRIKAMAEDPITNNEWMEVEDCW